MPIPREIVDWNILNEIVSMDEDDPEFSKGLIIQYFEQAETTFQQMQTNLEGSGDLKSLANLGHFLKGSSAALGLQRIAWVCERIQNLGRMKENRFPAKEFLAYQSALEIPNQGVYQDVRISDPQDAPLYLKLISEALEQARYEFALARKELSKYYGAEL